MRLLALWTLSITLVFYLKMTFWRLDFFSMIIFLNKEEGSGYYPEANNCFNIPSLQSFGILSNNSVALVHEQTIPTERPPLVDEVSANFCRWGVTWSAQRIPYGHNLGFLSRGK
jgi:hypothetical protein